MNQNDQNLLNELILESREHLAAIEPDLLILEKDQSQASDEIINRIFRAVHSIKGGFGFFGIETITRLSHSMENVMVRIRDHEIPASPDVVDGLLTGIDRLRTLLENVTEAPSADINKEILRLSPFLKSMTPNGTAKETGSVEGEELERAIMARHSKLTDDMFLDALRNGKTIYQILLSSKADFDDKGLSFDVEIDKWDKLGSVLDIVIDSSGGDAGFSIIFATVLEPDLVSTGLGIDGEKILAIDMSTIKKRLSSKALPEQAAAGQAGSGAAEKAGSPKAASQEVKIEDALRVKVGLLNNLMNLAGEMVLSRNQLLQTLGRELTEYIDVKTLFAGLTEQFLAIGEQSASGSRASGTKGYAQLFESAAARLEGSLRQQLALKVLDLPGVRSIVQNIDLVTSLLQENIMQTRLQPIAVVFSKFPRIIRDLAKKLNKEAELVITGQDVELDKSIIELLSDPLTHLVRNSIDHGIESMRTREAHGKSIRGRVCLRAYHEGGKVNIEIEDDGGGINTDRVRALAIQKGLTNAEDAAKMSDSEINMFIMAPGFSTAETVSDISGRGVGMDVVKTNIERLGGIIEIESKLGRGTKVIMKLPLTLAIISSLIVTVDRRRFAVPQVSIEELVRIRVKEISKKIERVGQSEVLRLRGTLLPLVRLTKVLGIKPTFVDVRSGEVQDDRRDRWSDRRGVPDTSPEAAVDERRTGKADRRTNVHNAVKIIVLRTGEHKYGLVVDEVHDCEEIVVKPLSSYIKSCSCYAGSTIMGDGSVAMILDSNGIARHAGLKFADIDIENAKELERRRASEQHQLHDILLFNNNTEERFAVSLTDVARVEKIPAGKIQRIGNQEFLNYEKYSLRLIRLEECLQVASPANVLEDVYVIVPKKSAHPLGIVTAKVDDVVRVEMTVEHDTYKGPGIEGTMLINSALTLLVDLNTVIQQAA